MGGDLLGGQVIKLKDVLDELLFLMVDAAVLAAGVHHHADVLLAHLLLGLVGINAQQPQYAVGRRAQQPHNGCEQLGDDSDETGDVQRYLLRLLHGDPLGNQLAEHQREEGQDQRDQDHGEGVQRGGGNRYAQLHQPVHQRVGEILRREGAAQKARQGDGHLNSGQEPGRLGRLAFRLPSDTILLSFTSFTDSTAISAQANTAFRAISTTCKSNNQPIEVSKFCLLSRAPLLLRSASSRFLRDVKSAKDTACVPRAQVMSHVILCCSDLVQGKSRCRLCPSCDRTSLLM